MRNQLLNSIDAVCKNIYKNLVSVHLTFTLDAVDTDNMCEYLTVHTILHVSTLALK